VNVVLLLKRRSSNGYTAVKSRQERTHSSRPEEKQTLSSGCAILVFPIIYAAHRFEQCSAHDEQPLRPPSVLLAMALMCSTLITLLFWQKGAVEW
jgi:hypothetical protein